MSLAADLLARLRGLLRRGREDDETAEELRFHLEMEAEKNVHAGMTPDEARRQAHACVWVASTPYGRRSGTRTAHGRWRT